MKKNPDTLPRVEAASLAYQNPAFLNSPDGRIVRIVSEYSEPLARFRRERIQDTVVFFGSARLLSLEEAKRARLLLDEAGSAAAVPEQGQPASHASANGAEASELRRRAEVAVEMARYYEDARRLAFLLTQWTQTFKSRRYRFVVTSGGGPGIMEAANRGASEAGGKTIGLNIRLPIEQEPNPYVTPSLNFEFHYFFMRKYWFAYLAKALVVFPGGFGTLDELFELLTLAQTQKLAKQITIVIYGSSYWKRLLDMDALVERGAISPRDCDLLRMVDTPEEAFQILKEELTRNHLEHESKPQAQTNADEEQLLNPEIARTR
jgi:uncharacterized protein (TIGR00730 family)